VSQVIRPAIRTDVSAIIPLWLEGMTVHASIDPRFPLADDSEQKFESYLNEVLSDRNAFLFVAETGSNLVGYCLGRIRQHPPVFTKQTYGYINDLMVASAYRRKGIGKALFIATATAIRARGVQDLEVSFVAKNEMSSSFWRKLGFKPRLETLRLEYDAT
jgi:ribosomal protein S18 acetylase RimI-like enzyme